MRIQVLYFEGCPNYARALELVRSVAGSATVEAVEIKTQEEAMRMRFLGSPTILVDGVDVDPDARTRTDFGFTCRTYGGSGVPSRELVAAAIAGCSRALPMRAGRNWFSGGAVALAAMGSACCWLPLVLLGLGLSSVGWSSTFESLHPWLIASSTILLAAGFYRAYRSQACCTPRARRLNRTLVWMAAGIVLALASFPWYARALTGQVGGAACCTASDSACCTSESGTPTVQQVAAAEPKTAVTVLSDDARELKQAFNTDQGSPRVMLIVSPLCPACRAGASVVQKEALAQVDNDKLKVYVVWINRFPGDSLKAAQAATSLISDNRAVHFWDGGALGRQYGKVVPLPGGKKFAWDVYFVFGPEAQWSDAPPAPAFWMHQLGGRETGNLLDGQAFREAVLRQLPKDQP